MFTFNMNLEVAQPVSSVWAVRAVERLLPSVSHHVVVQMLPLVTSVEQLATHWAN